MTYDSIAHHENMCPEYPVVCPRQCGNGGSLKRKNLKEHANTCPLEPEVCKDCLVEIIRKEMANHRTNKCPKRSITCRYCQMIGAFDHITGQHVNECEEFPTGCPRKCKGSEQMKRKNINSHSEVCPLEPVQCPFSEVGCTPQLVRRDLNSHMKSNLEQHMLKVMTSHTQLVAENERLKNDYGKLKDDFSKLKDDHSKLNNDHSMLKDNYSKLKDDCSNLSSELADIRAKSSTSVTSRKVESSISYKLGAVKNFRDVGMNVVKDIEANVPLQSDGIKTALNPIIQCERDKLVLHVPEIEGQGMCSPFYVLDGYKMCLMYKKIDDSRTASANSKIDVSLHLMKGEKDGSLKWPINSCLMLKIVLKSTAHLKKYVHDLEGHRRALHGSLGLNPSKPLLLPIQQTLCEETKFALVLNNHKYHNLDRVEGEMSRELKCKSMYSCGPLKAEITLSN